MYRARSSAVTWSAIALSLAYWVLAGLRAVYRPLWFDEIYTWYVAELPSLAAIRTALLGGVDQNLPFTHLSVRASHALFGTGPLATRLPAAVGFWIMLLAIYVFLKRRLPAPYALAGMLFPLLTFAWYYTSEARGYGILLGCGGMAVVLWQNAAMGYRRTLSLVGIAISLAVALATHYTALLLAIPLALGEVVRTVERRRVDVALWCAFGAAIPVVLIYPPLLAATHDWVLTGLRPGLNTIPEFYANALKPAITPVLLAFLAMGVVLLRKPDNDPKAGAEAGFPRHEMAALAGFAVTPLCFIAGCMVARNSLFFDRYGLLSVIGFACLFALLLCRVANGRRQAGAAAVLAMAAWFAGARGLDARRTAPPSQQVQTENALLLEALTDGRPVIVPNALTFGLVAFHRPDRAGQMYYVYDHQIARAYKASDVTDQLLERGARYFPLKAHVETWNNFTRQNPRFLFYFDVWSPPWFMDTLLRGPWQVTLKRNDGAKLLYEVSAISAAPPQ